jgi:hypothetical protein
MPKQRVISQLFGTLLPHTSGVKYEKSMRAST